MMLTTAVPLLALVVLTGVVVAGSLRRQPGAGWRAAAFGAGVLWPIALIALVVTDADDGNAWTTVLTLACVFGAGAAVLTLLLRAARPAPAPAVAPARVRVR